MDGAQYQHHVHLMAEQEQERRAHQNRREQVRDLVKQTTCCDGSTTTAVRNWIREVNLAFDQLGQGHITEVAAKTVTGPLRFELERFLQQWTAAQGRPRHEVPWPVIREHLSSQFLHLDEAQALKNEVAKLRQTPYESEVQFARRLRDLADIAYPAPERTPDQDRTLSDVLINGLQSAELRRTLVQVHDPRTLEAAITAMTRCRERDERLQHYEPRREEPMDVSAVDKNKELHQLEKVCTSMCRTLEGLTTRLAKLEAPHKATEAVGRGKRPRRSDGAAPLSAPAPGQRGRRRTTFEQRAGNDGPHGPAWDTQGRPRCYNCQRYGHFSRECNEIRQGNGPRS